MGNWKYQVHEYDTVLKSLLAGSENFFFQYITGAKRGRWLNVEFPRVNQRRVDLLFEVEMSLALIAVELQSRNDPLIAVRMAEYALMVYRMYQRFPKQYVLYIGGEELHMPSELVGDDFACLYQVIDIRSFDSEVLLNSPYEADAVLAILGRHSDKIGTVQRILQRIAKLEEEKRKDAFAKLTILAGIRNLGHTLQAEVKHMPILDDIMDHDLLGPAIRQGRAEGLQEGRTEGHIEEAKTFVESMLSTKFGPISSSIQERLNTFSLSELRDLGLRLLNAESLKDLFQ